MRTRNKFKPTGDHCLCLCVCVCHFRPNITGPEVTVRRLVYFLRKFSSLLLQERFVCKSHKRLTPLFRVVFGWFSPLLRTLFAGLEHIDLLTLSLPDFEKVLQSTFCCSSSIFHIALFQNSVDRLILTFLGKHKQDLSQKEVISNCSAEQDDVCIYNISLRLISQESLGFVCRWGKTKTTAVAWDPVQRKRKQSNLIQHSQTNKETESNPF